MVSQAQIDEIVRILVRECQPEKIILFGSHASGEADDDSDLDLAIVKQSELSGFKRPIDCEVTHLVTSSKERRDARNRLFPVNLADMLLRHSSANHKRETIAWSKRRQASAERLAVFLVWRNYMKGRKEKVRGSPTPAQVRGMRADRLEIGELLENRLFASRITLPQRWLEYYGRGVWTRVLERQRAHDLKYAF